MSAMISATADFVAHLRSLDIRLTVEDDRLRCSAPKGAMTPALRDQLAIRKSELIDWLKAPEQSNGDTATASASGENGDQEPLSFAQLRLWFIDQFQPGGYEYNITGGIRMRGHLELDALERSIGEVVHRHEPLRTVFATFNGLPTQVVKPFEGFSLTVRQLQPQPEDRRLQLTEPLLVEEGRRPFDLARGPLFRAQLYRLGPDDHLLQLTMHHVVADGWSLGVLYRELTNLYELNLDRKGGATLPALPLRYADISGSQRERLQGAVLERLEAYWKSRLTPSPTVLALPTDYPRPALQSSHGAVESILVPPALVERMQRLNRAQGVTLFMSLYAAFTVVLHRYTSATDIAVGVPIANRLNVEAEAVIGLMVNTLVFRTDLTGDPTFLELLGRTRDVALGAYTHQDYPFERLVEVLKPPRDMSHPVLFQVMFIFQNYPSQPVELRGLTLSYPVVRTGTSKVDLTLEVVERPDGLGLFMEYNTDLFRPDTIRRLCNHLEMVLTSVVDNPARPISQLPLLSRSERRQIVSDWNATAAPELSADTVPRQFEARVECAPTAPAARFGTRLLTYAELNARVNQLARYLRRLGVGPNVLVGICLERSLDMLVAVMAVMKASGAYVPLDPAYPADRLDFMIQDASLGVVITEQALANQITMPTGARSISVDAEANAIAREADSNLGDHANADDLAYVIYTSGSTGRPKGVQISHRSLINVLSSFQQTLDVRDRDVLVALTTLSFDIAGLELLCPLVSGAQVVIGSREVAADPAALADLLLDTRATIAQATPTTWRMLLESGWRRGEKLRILCGGEAFPGELAAPLLATGASVWNVYGPTETTIWSTVHRLADADRSVPIGRPIANTRIYILDVNGEPTPIGVPGELFIGGVGVAKGYLNRPDLTAERFVSDRLSDTPGSKLYRTGDIARYRFDGAIEFMGRVDHQVKIRGFRIELGEIESILTSNPAILQAVVVPGKGNAGEQRLAAYLRIAGPSAPSIGEIRALLREKLPEYMVPSTFTMLDHFPMTPNGKVDRRQLPEPEADRSSAAVPFLAPSSAIERSIAEVWCELLHLAVVGADDNFFDLGGHSLLVVQLQAKLRQKLDRVIPIVEMFQYPTIRTIAAHLARQ